MLVKPEDLPMHAASHIRQRYNLESPRGGVEGLRAAAALPSVITIDAGWSFVCAQALLPAA